MSPLLYCDFHRAARFTFTNAVAAKKKLKCAPVKHSQWEWISGTLAKVSLAMAFNRFHSAGLPIFSKKAIPSVI
jgi:hypothetical protein